MNTKLKSIVLGITAFVVLTGIIAFASAENDNRVCNEVVININNQLNNHFIDVNDVLSLVNDNGASAVIGESFGRINVRSIEERVKMEPFIRDAEIFRDHKGNLVVNVDQRKPVARIIRSDGPDAYIADDGYILPVSEKFSARVVLVSGTDMKGLSESVTIAEGEYEQLFEMINYINSNEFFKAQIAQINFENEDEVVLYPQMTKQLIDFGTLEHMEAKFKKLMIFYKQILPRKGWNVYKRVNLKYNDQIICE